VKNDVVLGIGSNIEPLANIEKALKKIKEKVSGLKVSRFVETEPLGFKDQAHFLNGAVRFKTESDRDPLKKWLLSLEDELGRMRTKNRNAPRTIDLDILVWNGKVVDEDVYERDFLQKAIKELAPTLAIEHVENEGST